MDAHVRTFDNRNFDSNDDVKVESNDNVALPIHNSPTYEDEGTLGHDMDCMEASRSSIVELDNNV